MASIVSRRVTHRPALAVLWKVLSGCSMTVATPRLMLQSHRRGGGCLIPARQEEGLQTQCRVPASPDYLVNCLWLSLCLFFLKSKEVKIERPQSGGCH